MSTTSPVNAVKYHSLRPKKGDKTNESAINMRIRRVGRVAFALLLGGALIGAFAIPPLGIVATVLFFTTAAIGILAGAFFGFRKEQPLFKTISPAGDNPTTAEAKQNLHDQLIENTPPLPPYDGWTAWHLCQYRKIVPDLDSTPAGRKPTPSKSEIQKIEQLRTEHASLLKNTTDTMEDFMKSLKEIIEKYPLPKN